jgi:hypothetical protein
MTVAFSKCGLIEDHDEVKEREGVVVTYQRDLMVLSDALR